jgi:hypothetical protein
LARSNVAAPPLLLVTKFQSEDISPLHLVELGADVALRTLPNDNRLVQVMATQQHSRAEKQQQHQ